MVTLYDWQQPGAARLVEILTNHQAALDCSDTGVGKSYVALEVARKLNCTPVIVTPKSAVSAFARVSTEMGIQCRGIVNIEALKTGKYPWLQKDATGQYKWTVTPDTLVIWDEVHNAGGLRTDNSKVLALTKAYGIRTLMLSATVADNPAKLRSVGFLLGLHNYVNQDYFRWCWAHGCTQDGDGPVFTRSPQEAKKHMLELHRLILPRSVRVRIADLPEFPECETQAKLFDLDAEYTKEVNEAYSAMAANIGARPSTWMVELLRARQKAELMKVPLILELTQDLLDEGKSVVIFVNFRDSLGRIESHFKNRVVTVHGDQTPAERGQQIAAFQADTAHVCVAMLQAGGQSISLHDLHGNRARHALIMPSFSVVNFKQCLGRIHRAGAKSKAVQTIVLAANTIEERVYSAIKRKLRNLDSLQDGDLTGLTPE